MHARCGWAVGRGALRTHLRTSAATVGCSSPSLQRPSPPFPLDNLGTSPPPRTRARATFGDFPLRPSCERAEAKVASVAAGMGRVASYM